MMINERPIKALMLCSRSHNILIYLEIWQIYYILIIAFTVTIQYVVLN